MDQTLPGEFDAYELLPEGVLALDLDRRLLWASGRATRLCALTDDAIGRSLDDVLHLRTEGGDPCGIGDLLVAHGDRVAERVLDVELPDGRRRTIAFAGRRLADGTLVTIRHAGRRKQLDRTRSDLVATVSHEIRSPLTSVKGFTKTLLAKWDRFGDEQKKLMLETINEDADRVTRLLTELLDVSRIDAHKVQLRRVAVDLSEVAEGVVERARVKPLAQERKLVAEVEAVPRTLLDSDKVSQVLTNLVENALNHGEGTITVRVVAGDGVVETSVRDEGPGIDADQAKTIFEKFGRGREVRRAGTGLGLYISRGLVRAHGGELRVDSERGVGTTFTASWPVPEGT